MPKVSVIIPVYNGERFIAQAVDSVLNQTYRDFELIVVDDGSTDKTAEILKSYGSQIIYIYQPNRERSAARNTGIRHAQGEYLAFLDADDVWLPHKLQRQVQLLDQASEVGLVYGWAYFIDETGQRVNLSGKEMLCSFESGTRVFEPLLFENVIASPTVMIRRHCIDTVGFFDESMTYTEDWDMWLRIAVHYKVGIINEPLACYRINGDSLLENWKKYDVPSGRIRVVKKACTSLKDHPELRSLRRKALAHSYWWSAVASHRMGHRGNALKYGLCALVRNPRLMVDKHAIAIWMDIVIGKSISNTLRTLRRRIMRLDFQEYSSNKSSNDN